MKTPPRNATARRRLTQRGGAILLEFALAIIVLGPLTFGTIAVGLGLTRYLQTGSVCRSAASMFVRGVDFSRSGNQMVLGKVAEGLGMTHTDGTIRTNGRGVIILSIVMRIGDTECANGGYPIGDGRCTNRGKVVVTRRIVVGNSSLRSSAYASPAGTQTTDGSYSAVDYLITGSFAVPVFGTMTAPGQTISGAPLHLGPGELSYLVESYFTAPELNLIPRVLPVDGFYHKNFF